MKENYDYSVQRCDDGKYRWRYELDMWKKPSILILIFKIFFWVFVGIWGFMIILTVIEDGWNLDKIWDTSLPFLILIGVFTVIALIAYAIVAAMYGGKYIVLFEMDEKGVNHCQVNAQAMRARKMGIITAAAGVATGNLTTAGIGATSALRSSLYTSFNKVRSIQCSKHRNLIKVNELFFKNQVYVRDEDFDFVYEYIKSHCPQIK